MTTENLDCGTITQNMNMAFARMIGIPPYLIKEQSRRERCLSTLAVLCHPHGNDLEHYLRSTSADEISGLCELVAAGLYEYKGKGLFAGLHCHRGTSFQYYPDCLYKELHYTLIQSPYDRYQFIDFHSSSLYLESVVDRANKEEEDAYYSQPIPFWQWAVLAVSLAVVFCLALSVF
jgi:hypothetical protein